MIEWFESNPETITGISSIVIAGAAVVTVLLTAVTVWLTRALADENRRLRKAGTEPNVVPYLKIESQRTRAINFVLANVGQGPAKNIKYRFLDGAKDLADSGIAVSNHQNRTPISLLPQGERVEEFFAFGPHVLGDPVPGRFAITVKYENLNGKSDGWFEHSLDLAQFKDFSWLGLPPEDQLVETLNKIESHLRR